jgi:hypothetical protein
LSDPRGRAFDRGTERSSEPEQTGELAALDRHEEIVRRRIVPDT